MITHEELLGKIIISLAKLEDDELTDILRSIVEIEKETVGCWESDEDFYYGYSDYEDEDYS